MKETSPKSNNGTILDNNDDFKIAFDPISDALAAIRNGECIIVVDDERRENEGDLICAAQFATPQQINFMALLPLLSASLIALLPLNDGSNEG